MKKTQLIIPSILSIMSFTLSSGQASMMEENDANLATQFQHSSTISKEQVFNRKDCYRAIAQKHGDLSSFYISDEDKLIIMFDLGKLYCDFAKNSKNSAEKRAYYKEAKNYFEESRSPKAVDYLNRIRAFLNGYDN